MRGSLDRRRSRWRVRPASRTDERGVSAAGVPVRGHAWSERVVLEARTVLDEQGRFNFPGLKFARGRIQVVLANHRTESQELTLDRGTATLRVVMEYNGPPVPVANGGISTDDLNRR